MRRRVSSVDDLIAFLRARLDEEEQAANAAAEEARALDGWWTLRGRRPNRRRGCRGHRPMDGLPPGSAAPAHRPL
ncbi:DUF6221 family protein [Nonomuraea polychroma]|uniref:DUF6221 family protein n=1 Tax=Nonomuraea polychroma TaxID=46176 RepID=UPI003BAC9FB9